MVRQRLILTAWRLNKVSPIVIAVLVLLNLAAHLVITNLVEPHGETLEHTLLQKQVLLRQFSERQSGSVSTPQGLYRQAEADLERFREAIPDRTEFTPLISEVFSLAQGAGLLIDRITYSPEEIREKGLLQYALNFSVAGDYGQIKKFIHSLEQSPRIVIIEKIALGGSEDPDRKGVGLNIRLSTYFQSDAS